MSERTFDLLTKPYDDRGLLELRCGLEILKEGSERIFHGIVNMVTNLIGVDNDSGCGGAACHCG